MGRGTPSILIACAAMLLAVGVPTSSRAGGVAESSDQCVVCHSDPAFLVTNKKLYDYYQQWTRSIHRQEEVTCEDCHGGDPDAPDKRTAHGKGIGADDPASGVYFKNVPDTCGTCHDEILEGFRKSAHFEHVAKKEGEDQGPTCVTCHGSIDSEVLDVNTVADACARCHNDETDNHPENPEKAREVLNRFLSIHRFYRYITIHAKPEEAKAFFEKIDPLMAHLAITWHTFDLDDIDRETGEVLSLMKKKRDEIRSRRAARK
jgi:hypothetical protein